MLYAVQCINKQTLNNCAFGFLKRTSRFINVAPNKYLHIQRAIRFQLIVVIIKTETNGTTFPAAWKFHQLFPFLHLFNEHIQARKTFSIKFFVLSIELRLHIMITFILCSKTLAKYLCKVQHLEYNSSQFD